MGTGTVVLLYFQSLELFPAHSECFKVFFSVNGYTHDIAFLRNVIPQSSSLPIPLCGSRGVRGGHQWFSTMPQSIWAAITKTTRNYMIYKQQTYFLEFQRVGSPRSRHRQICCLSRTQFSQRAPSSHEWEGQVKGAGTRWTTFRWMSVPLLQSPHDLINYKKNHLFI